MKIDSTSCRKLAEQSWLFTDLFKNKTAFKLLIAKKKKLHKFQYNTKIEF